MTKFYHLRDIFLPGFFSISRDLEIEVFFVGGLEQGFLRYFADASNRR